MLHFPVSDASFQPSTLVNTIHASFGSVLTVSSISAVPMIESL
jgi:hypothetical protein